MSTFTSSDLFFLQRPSDTADPYKAVSRESMKKLGIVRSRLLPINPDEGQLWCNEDTRSLSIYNGYGWDLIASISTHATKVSRSGDSMTGDLVMSGDANINFPVLGGLTIGESLQDSITRNGHMVLVSYDSNVRPQGLLTIPGRRGFLDSIAKWTEDGLHVFKDPGHHSHVTHKKYVDDENHNQDLVIQQNTTDIIALFDDLESVRPSTMRAKYDYIIPNTYGDNAPKGRVYFGNGTTTLTTYTDSITEIFLNKKANNGITYDFSSINQDHYVEIQDVKGIGIFLAEVDTVTEVVDYIKIELNVLKYRDEGTLSGDPEPTEIRLLIFEKNIQLDVDADDRYAKLHSPNLFTRRNTFGGPDVVIDSTAPLPANAAGAPTTNIFRVLNGATGITPATERFKITSEGDVTAGTVPDPFIAQYDNDVVVKAYLDERMKRVGAYYGDTPPLNPMPGMLWYDTKENDLTMYMYYENPDATRIWVPVYSPTKGNGGGSGYIDKTGGTMTGPLVVQDTLEANKVETLKVDSGEASNLNLQWNGQTKVYVGNTNVTIGPPLQLNTEGTDDKHAVTKKYVDDKDVVLDRKINTFREDLETISPILVRGQWKVDHIGSAGRVPNPGYFAIYKIASQHEFITDFIDTHEIWLPEKDALDVFHDFTKELIVDKYIYIYDEDDKDYILGVITGLEEDNFRDVKYYKIIVKPIQSRGLPHDDDTCYIKIFEPPTGGDSSQFVVKSDFKEFVDMMKEAVEVSTDFDTLRSNLMQTLDNYSLDT